MDMSLLMMGDSERQSLINQMTNHNRYVFLRARQALEQEEAEQREKEWLSKFPGEPYPFAGLGHVVPFAKVKAYAREHWGIAKLAETKAGWFGSKVEIVYDRGEQCQEI